MERKLFKQKFNSDSEDEEYVPTAKELEESKENKSKSKSDLKATKSRVDAFWEKKTVVTKIVRNPNKNIKKSVTTYSNKLDNKKFNNKK